MNDFISRDAAKQFVRSKRGAELLKHSLLNAITVLQLIDELPAVDAALVTHGQWTHYLCIGHDRYQCSECSHWIGAGIDRNYCPNCGAKMENNNE